MSVVPSKDQQQLRLNKIDEINDYFVAEIKKRELMSKRLMMATIDEEKEYWELKESVWIMNSQRSDNEKINLIEEGKKIGIDKAIKYK